MLVTTAAKVLLPADRAQLNPVLASTAPFCSRRRGRDPDSHKRFYCSGLSAYRYPTPAAQVVRSTLTVNVMCEGL